MNTYPPYIIVPYPREIGHPRKPKDWAYGGFVITRNKRKCIRKDFEKLYRGKYPYYTFWTFTFHK